ncbi:hypothetical protein JCM19235_1935 [Vibrio maritimus]|uniref:Uncharacterized protein n=1 Tax=Vibrio maritimus TaxID=990268 RepID=A0A090SGD0_9VIBR|nr:hypothetical protein JCM19235_1935 [Vibrio maritimus]
MRKTKKQDAKKAFLKIAKKRTEHPLVFANMLIADVKTRIDNQQLGFDKLHPATYLNGKRWEDEYVIDRQEADATPGDVSPSEEFRAHLRSQGKNPNF